MARKIRLDLIRSAGFRIRTQYVTHYYFVRKILVHEFNRGVAEAQQHLVHITEDKGEGQLHAYTHSGLRYRGGVNA